MSTPCPPKPQKMVLTNMTLLSLRLFFLLYVGWRGYRAALDIGCPRKHRKYLAYFDRVSIQNIVSACRRGGCFLREDGGRRHLPAGHPVNGVIDKYNRYIFTSVGCVKTLRGTDCGKIAVSLIREDDPIGQNPLQAGGGCRTPAMLCLD